MIDGEYIHMMARYSAWQNASIANAAELLNDAERLQTRGAFFGSIQGTMNHLLWGDRIWMHKFANTRKPNMDSIASSINETNSWATYRYERAAMDLAIVNWAEKLDAAWLQGDLTWFSSAVNRNVSKSKQTLIVHFLIMAPITEGRSMPCSLQQAQNWRIQICLSCQIEHFPSTSLLPIIIITRPIDKHRRSPDQKGKNRDLAQHSDILTLRAAPIFVDYEPSVFPD